jgi:RNA polymerase sigma-70 factor (ECF subfamily)
MATRAKAPSSAREAREASARAPDPDLMQRLADGEIGALGELYDRYHEGLRRFFARATADAADVDDLVHATFLTAAKAAGRYDGRPSCRPWLVGIAVRLLRRRRRAFGKLLAVLSSIRGTAPATADPRPALHARSAIERALGRLSEAHRIPLLMAEVEGFSSPEIAAALGVPVGTVWSRLHAARRELREALEEGPTS